MFHRHAISKFAAKVLLFFDMTKFWTWEFAFRN